MPKSRKPRYHHGNLRESLIENSLELIEKEGIEGLTLRKVARLSGVSPMAPYAHFADKDDLIAALKEEGFRELRKEIDAGRAKGRTKTDTLARVAQAYVGFALTRPAMFQVMFRNPMPTERHKPQYDFVQPGVEIFESLVPSFADRGKMAQRHLALIGWALVHGLVSLRIDGPLDHVLPETRSRAGFEKLAQELTAALIAALKL